MVRYFKIYENLNPIHLYVPAKSGNTLGVYDYVTDSFKAIQKTGVTHVTNTSVYNESENS